MGPTSQPGDDDTDVVAGDDDLVRAPFLLLVADTGGGHRRAAEAVAQALDALGRSAVIWDPLGDGCTPTLARRAAGLYGPVVRRAPAVWGALFRATDNPAAMSLVHYLVFAGSTGSVRAAIGETRPSAVVSFHALLTRPAVAAARGSGIPVATVVTDLGRVHRAWLEPGVDQVITAADHGVPVAASFAQRPVGAGDLRRLRTGLGLCPDRFTVLVGGGGEGCGGLGTAVDALLDAFDDVTVVASCGRNRRLHRALARRAGPRLVTLGFVEGFADWVHAADVVVTKAGPGGIAEALVAGAPLLLTSALPGQEEGNVAYAVGTGAAVWCPQRGDLLGAVRALRNDPSRLDAMRRQAVLAARPRAAAEIAAALVALHPRDREPAA